MSLFICMLMMALYMQLDIRTIKPKIVDAFAKIVNWIKLNKLTVHPGETNVQLIMSFPRATKHSKVTKKYQNQILEQVSNAKLLGIHIDSNLTWQLNYYIVRLYRIVIVVAKSKKRRTIRCKNNIIIHVKRSHQK